MEAVLKARQIGGSIGILIPKEIVEKESIHVDDSIKVRIEKTADLSFMVGKFKDLKRSTDQIMREIDEGEFDD